MFSLERAAAGAQRKGISVSKCLVPDPAISLTLQSRLYNKLRGAYGADHVYRIRDKLRRWKLDEPIGIVGCRTQPRMVELSSLVPPRVLACVFRTIWNGWCTAARFQREAQCVMNFPETALDKIEHYAHCKFTRWLAYHMFGCSAHKINLASFLLMSRRMPRGDLVRMSTMVFSVYTVTNKYRSACRTTENEVKDALEEAAKQVLCGSRRGVVMDKQ